MKRTARELTFYFESGIRAFVHQMNRRKTIINNEGIFFAGEADSLQLEAALQYTQSFDERINAFANTINNVDGGTHLTGFRSALTRTLNDYARKQNPHQGERSLPHRRRRAHRTDGRYQRAAH